MNDSNASPAQTREGLHERHATRRELEAERRLQEISSRLISHEHEDSLYQEILDAAMVIMDSDAASVQRLESDGRLRLLGSRGFHPDSAAYWEWVSVDHSSACGIALRTGDRVIAEDVESPSLAIGEGDLDSYRRSGIRAAQSTLLRSRSGQPLGMISSHWYRPHRPGERELRMLDILARQAAELIERMHSREALERESAAARAAEAHGRLLVHELSHRVKNTLATVQSVAIQTLRSADSLEAFSQDFLARLAALAQTHDLLMRNQWHGADLREMLDQELKPYGRPDGPRLSLQGEPVRLDPKVALALGMALHELATNAAKYGALSCPQGELQVEWHRDPDEALHIRWTERGGPAVQPPTRRGFGSRVIEQGLAYELEAEVRLGFDPSGVSCMFRIPLTAQLGGMEIPPL